MTDPSSRATRERRSGVASRTPRLVAVPVVVVGFLALYFLLQGDPVVRSDETWFLWAMDRVTRGDVLYRDVYFVTTPLSAWLGAVTVAVGGPTLAVVRLLSVALFITAACLAWCIAARSHAGIAGRVLLVATLVVYASPVAHFASVYSSLAVVCAMATMWSALRWLDARERRAGLRKAKRGLPPVGWLWGSGIAAGASIASKPNTGALALGALLVTVVVARRDALSAVREAAHIVFAATSLCAATIVPVVLNGAFSSFVSDVLLEKGDYVRVMSTSPVPGLGRTLSILHGTARSTAAHPLGAELGSRLYDTFRVLPLLIIAVLSWAAWRSRARTRGRVTLGVAFATAGLLSAVPIFGPQHAAEALPLAMTATVSAASWARSQPARRPASSVRTVAVTAAAAWLLFGIGAISARSLAGLDGDAGARSTLPSVGSSPVRASEVRWTEHDIARLRELTHGRVFIIRGDASYYYLIGHLVDPTPFDFPVRSDFGSAGEGGVIELIRTHRIAYACILRRDRRSPSSGPDFRPLAVEHAVRSDMHWLAHLRICDLYSSQSSTLAQQARRGHAAES